MLDLMLRMIIVGGLTSAAAALFERALPHLSLGRRWAWTFALVTTALLPWLPELRPAVIPDIVPQISGPSLVVIGTEVASSNILAGLTPLWIVMMVAVAGVYGIAFVRLMRDRKTWSSTRLVDHEVLLSVNFGPAVFGLTRPVIVVPSWAQKTSLREQELIVLHEREHIRAGDHLQLLLIVLATVATPWNPFTWLQARRLRFTIEADCDQRVLARAPDAGAYARLLLDVGSQQNGLLLTPALAENRNGLERRLTMLAQRLIRNRWKAAGLVLTGVVLTFVACETRLPSEPQSGEVPELSSSVGFERMRSGSLRIIEEEYPPLLRRAGVGGMTVLQLHVTDGGRADQVMVRKSSGHAALDEAAVRVVKRYQWGNEGPDRSTSYWTTTSITFSPAGQTTEPDVGTLRSKTRSVDIADAPHWIPYDKKPELRNRERVVEALAVNYPPSLKHTRRTNGAIVWTLVGEDGRVKKAQIKESDNRADIDAAVLRVAEIMEFSPAEHEGKPIAVWIQLPITFRAQ